MKVTDEEVRMWLGGTGNIQMDDVINLLVDIANGEYESEQLYIDISDYRRNR